MGSLTVRMPFFSSVARCLILVSLLLHSICLYYVFPCRHRHFAPYVHPCHCPRAPNDSSGSRAPAAPRDRAAQYGGRQSLPTLHRTPSRCTARVGPTTNGSRPRQRLRATRSERCAWCECLPAGGPARVYEHAAGRPCHARLQHAVQRNHLHVHARRGHLWDCV